MSITTTLQSVIEQTYTDWELIIVDDGSSDNSLNVVKEFVERIDNRWIDDRLTIISQLNAGVSAARNRGILEAKGEHVAFLDADDLWTTDCLETLAALIRDYPNAGLYCVGHKNILSSQIPDDLRDNRNEGFQYRGVMENPWTAKRDIFTGSCSGNRRKMIEIGLFDTRMTHGEDLDMWWRLILHGGMVVDEKCCAYYRLDSENSVMQQYIPLDKHLPYYMDKFAEERAKDADFRRFFDEQMIYRLYPYMLDKRYRKEARQIAKKIDYTQLKWSMHFRMLFPRVYYILRRWCKV